ncbi:hypothetical protein WR25_26172 [Diploscapter pachys]|uniref:Secreted protein n=1 Tax=Diploscapter pachys TaxID=2018661 RepID=A0A2A2J6C9_9BILA|nr:hypothetical protein WR25_26172 [Diploscapter pachys]
MFRQMAPSLPLYLLLLLALFALTFAVPSAYMCRTLMASVLRDPLQLSNWRPASYNRAVNQLHAYQQLFLRDDE